MLGFAGCEAIVGSADYHVVGTGGGTTGTGSTTSTSVSSTTTVTTGSSSTGSGSNPCDVPEANKPIVQIEGEIDVSQLLTCDKRYRLLGEVFVKPPSVLTIEPGTEIFGDKTSGAALVIMPGAKIIANGTKDDPIVFTSEGGQFADPGDWGGLVLLGNAPINLKDGGGQPMQGIVEGILSTQNALYGGTDPNDSSGSLQFVRVEYGGKAIAPNNELNGITFAGVGAGTVVDHVMVKQTTDDCFEFFGGNVGAKHLICQAPGDDGFDWDNGYTGKLQFLVLQQDVAYPTPQDMNGFEGDNDAGGTANLPLSEPTIYNATLCGQDYAAGQQYGALLRKNTRAHLFNLIVSGFEAGVDVRDASGPALELTNSIFFGNSRLAYPEDAAPPYNDDDAGFDEAAWLMSGLGNAFVDPSVPGCNDMTSLQLKPAVPLTSGAAAPPNDGFFDASASFQGAFRDVTDDWATGAWVSWSAQ
ncbi:MAG: hypothetical protein U0414_02545 [Polyangiaceae bacterium]